MYVESYLQNFRYKDDVLSLIAQNCLTIYVDRINPIELQIKDTTDS